MEPKTEQTAAEKYRELISSKKENIVDVTAPSGFVFKFKKPSLYGTLLSTNKLPGFVASKAAEAWKGQDGMPDDMQFKPAEQAELAEAAWAIRGRVLTLSHEPKLVAGPATAPNELSTDDVDEADLTYLFQWVAAGG